jgi:hypothetical protein
MQFLPRSFTADFQSDDDIDRLFSRLLQIEPPGELIARILSQVGYLPESSAFPPSIQQGGQNLPAGEGLDALVVRNETQEPS